MARFEQGLSAAGDGQLSDGRGRSVELRQLLRPSVVCWTCVAALLVGLVSPVRGQEGESHVILVNVLDRDGNQVPGLSAANFRGEYQGQPVTVVSAAPDSAPRRITLALDTSGSQVAEKGEQKEFSAAEELVRILTPQHRVGVFTFAHVLRMHSNLTNDQAALLKALGQAHPQQLSGDTPLYDTVLRLSRGLSGRRPGDAVLLFTDGDDTSSTLEANAAVTAIARTGVRVFVARTLDYQRRGPSYDRATYWIQSVTEATGGEACWLKDAQKLRTASSMMAEGYRLEVTFPRTVDEPRKWELEVIGPDRKKLPKVRLVYPHLVAPLLPPPS